MTHPARGNTPEDTPACQLITCGPLKLTFLWPPFLSFSFLLSTTTAIFFFSFFFNLPPFEIGFMNVQQQLYFLLLFLLSHTFPTVSFLPFFLLIFLFLLFLPLGDFFFSFLLFFLLPSPVHVLLYIALPTFPLPFPTFFFYLSFFLLSPLLSSFVSSLCSVI